MTTDLTPIDRAKYVAARRAVDLVEDGMKLGLGTGSTAVWMVRCLAEKVRQENLKVTCVPTSVRTGDLAKSLGLNVVTLNEAGWLDLTIDGTDEFDPALNLIKGGGGAHLIEKIVATASDRMVVITDASKEVAHLGAFPLPVEVVSFGWQASRLLIEELLGSMDVMGTEAVLRMNGDQPFRTDEGNFILDLSLSRIGNPRQLSLALNQVPGVVENGLFIDVCDTVVIGYGDGRVELRDLSSGTVEKGQIAIDLPVSNIFKDI